MKTTQTVRAFDGYHKNTGRKTELASFRIFKDQNAELSLRYTGNRSVLTRILLEQFLSGKLPSVEAEFEQITKKTHIPLAAAIIDTYATTNNTPSETAAEIGVSAQRAHQILHPER